jgi:maleamate amidohydrolase
MKKGDEDEMKETREAVHQKAGFTGHLPIGSRPGILVVDFQLGFTAPDLCPLAGECTVEVELTRKILDLSREKKIPIFFTAIGYSNEHDAGLWIKKVPSLRHLMLDSELVQIDPRLNVQQNEVVIIKKYASAFAGTSLASLASAQQVNTLLITGTTTSGCVRASAVDALQNGFTPYVVEDAVCDRSREAHKANLQDLKTKYAELISAEQVLTLLSS